MIHAEGRPLHPNGSIPPAIETSVGIQLPATIKGSIHSMMTTRVFREGAAEAIARIFERIVSTSESPFAPNATPVRRMSSKTSSSDCGLSGMIRGATPVQSAIAFSTSRRLTAQTSHWICVTTWVG